MRNLTPTQIRQAKAAVAKAVNLEDLSTYEVRRVRRNRKTGELRIELRLYGWDEYDDGAYEGDHWDGGASVVTTPVWNEELRLFV